MEHSVQKVEIYLDLEIFPDTFAAMGFALADLTLQGWRPYQITQFEKEAEVKALAEGPVQPPAKVQGYKLWLRRTWAAQLPADPTVEKVVSDSSNAYPGDSYESKKV